MTDTYFVQASTDNGKSFDNVKKTQSRTKAFEAFVDLGNDVRAKLYKNNKLIMTTHLEDAQTELINITTKAGA